LFNLEVFLLVIYYLYIYFSNTEQTLFLSLFHSLFFKPVIIKHVE